MSDQYSSQYSDQGQIPPDQYSGQQVPPNQYSDQQIPPNQYLSQQMVPFGQYSDQYLHQQTVQFDQYSDQYLHQQTVQFDQYLGQYLSQQTVQFNQYSGQYLSQQIIRFDQYLSQYLSQQEPIRILVGQFPEHNGIDKFQQFFSHYGEVTHFEIINRNAYIHMTRPEEAGKAIKGFHHFYGIPKVRSFLVEQNSIKEINME